MYDTVVIPTDGSEQAETAAEHGLALARTLDATVHVLTVVDVQAAGGLFDAGGVSEEFVERLADEARESVAAIEAMATDDDRVSGEVRRGKPGDAIVEYVEEVEADVVAMGTHGRTGVNRFLAGSVTEHVVRRSPVPVLTVRRTESGSSTDYDTVLFPTDGSEGATAAMEHAIALSSAYDATLHALSVIDITTMAAQPDATMIEPLLEQLRDDAEGAVRAVADSAGSDVDVVTETEEGYPAHEILAYRDDVEADLVVMGTKGLTGVKRFVLGSTAERVVRQSTAPVLTVRAPDHAPEE